MANKRVTRYVVTKDGVPVASFDFRVNAETYKEKLQKKTRELMWVETIRFRTPEVK